MEVPQQDRNFGMLAHGLVALTGLSSMVPGFAWFGLPAAIACVVLYFVYKGKSDFVSRNFKQAAGLQVILYVVGLLLSVILGGAATTAAITGGFGAAMAMGSLLFIIMFAFGIIALVFGVLGLLRAQNGQTYLYPVIGSFIDKLGF